MSSPLQDLSRMARLGTTPPLDPDFRPASPINRAFREAVRAAGGGVPLALALERGDGQISVFRTAIFPADDPRSALNPVYVERLVKFLLWQKGGWRVVVGGPAEIGEHIRAVYSPGGARAFDCDLMGRVYEKPFTVESVDLRPGAAGL